MVRDIIKKIISRVKLFIYGSEKCKRCYRLMDKSRYYKQRYAEAKAKLQESEEILNLAIGSIDLRKAKHEKLRERINNKK